VHANRYQDAEPRSWAAKSAHYRRGSLPSHDQRPPMPSTALDVNEVCSISFSQKNCSQGPLLPCHPGFWFWRGKQGEWIIQQTDILLCRRLCQRTRNCEKLGSWRTSHRKLGRNSCQHTISVAPRNLKQKLCAV